jgi:hypothetical protein
MNSTIECPRTCALRATSSFSSFSSCRSVIESSSSNVLGMGGMSVLGTWRLEGLGGGAGGDDRPAPVASSYAGGGGSTCCCGIGGLGRPP